MKKFAGFDVHRKQCTFVVEDENGSELSSGEIVTTAEAIEAWAKAHVVGCEVLVAMETGGGAHFVATQLEKHGIKVAVVNAAEVRAKAQRKNQKTDLRDARELCQGIRRGIYVSIVARLSEPQRKLRQALKDRSFFVRTKTREVNAVKSALREEGLGHLYRALATDKAWEKLMAKSELDEELKERIKRHREQWTLLKKHIAELDTKLDELGKEHAEQLRRLQTIPGFGKVVSLTVIAHYGDAKRFSSAKHASSYTGLVPSTYHSGANERFGHITRAGSTELRTMLVQAAQHAAKKDHPFHSFHRRIRAKKGYGTATIAVAHRLARVSWSMLVHEKDFDIGQIISDTSKNNHGAWGKLIQARGETN